MRDFRNDMRYADFPLGGIGTGTITLNAAGQLRDFQIFNRPSLGMKIPYSFFAMHTEWGGQMDSRAIQAEPVKDFYLGRGWHPKFTAGLPRFKTSRMRVRYPFAELEFHDDDFPMQVRLCAFTPFVPMNADDSGIPGIVFRYSVTNASDVEAEVLVAGSMANIHNEQGQDEFENPRVSDGLYNEWRDEGDLRGLFMSGSAAPENDLHFANSALMTAAEGAEHLDEWRETGWYDGITDFWNHFREGRLAVTGDNDTMRRAILLQPCKVGTLGIRRRLRPGETQDFTFVLSWYVPNRIRGWFETDNPGQTMKNYYASVYRDAWHAGSDLLRRLDMLEGASRRFADALYGSTLPEPMLDAVAANIAVLRSTTCWRAPDGTFTAWEGSHEQVGSCIGTCTHVWNYAQTAAFLFPELEQNARVNEFLVETNDDGKMTFRTQRGFGLPDWGMYPAADGQFGTVMRVWREWKLGGDKAFLQKVYPSLLRAFDFALREFDPDGDGVPEARQHNTYDIEFYGPNPLTGVMLLGAARAVQEIAEIMGDSERVQSAKALFEKARGNLERACWQGEYYAQKLDDVNAYPYQFGEGCLSDQLFGQTLASLYGLGDLLPREHLKSAVEAVYRHNFLPGERRNPCLQRLYVADDEQGMVLCSWPTGGMPRLPFVYSDEVWTGIEYQVATLLIYEGLVDEALDVVSAVRERFDGVRRAPFNEMECGFYYTRAMASWGLLIAMSGFQCDVNRRSMEFKPVDREGKLFWSMKPGWGTFAFDESSCKLDVSYGEVALKELRLPAANIRAVRVNGCDIPFVSEGGCIRFDGLTLGTSDRLTVEF